MPTSSFALCPLLTHYCVYNRSYQRRLAEIELVEKPNLQPEVEALSAKLKDAETVIAQLKASNEALQAENTVCSTNG